MNLKKIFITTCLFALSFNAQAAINKENNKSHLHKKLEHHDFKNILHNLFPKERIEMQNIKNAIVLSGNVSCLEVSDKIEKLAKEYFSKELSILNFMQMKSTQQVMLKVKLGEITKTGRGSNAFSNSSSNFDHLEKAGMIKKLAEPNLIAMSGEEAEFESGGEIPLPVIQKNGNMSIEYKPYGIKLAFTPLVLSQNRIRLSVEPEIKDIVKMDSINNGKFPVFSNKKAKTTIELAPGESFMIAGLVKDYDINNNRQTSELVVSVTPYLVNGMQGKDAKLPNHYNSSNLESKFISKVNNKFKTNISNSQTASEGALSLEGPIGFVTE